MKCSGTGTTVEETRLGTKRREVGLTGRLPLVEDTPFLYTMERYMVTFLLRSQLLFIDGVSPDLKCKNNSHHFQKEMVPAPIDRGKFLTLHRMVMFLMRIRYKTSFPKISLTHRVKSHMNF